MKRRGKIQVVVVMGSRSDLRIMKDAAHFAGKPRDMSGSSTEILSGPPDPRIAGDSFRSVGKIRVLSSIVAGEPAVPAHLPGMLASYTRLPVIGVPVAGRSMNGLDSSFEYRPDAEGCAGGDRRCRRRVQCRSSGAENFGVGRIGGRITASP